MIKRVVFAVAATIGLAQAAQAQVYITEWMYQGGSGEFIEFTNLGPTAVDFTGWSYDDEKARPGLFSLSAFGLVASGESVIITEAFGDDLDLFKLDWGLGANVKVIGGIGNSAFGPTNNNIGRADTLHLFNASGQVVDVLKYGDNTVGGPRTQNVSGRAGSLAALGANDATQWVLSAVGDVEGSYMSLSGAVGSPGMTGFTPAVPEPSTYALLLAGVAVVGAVAQRRRQA